MLIYSRSMSLGFWRISLAPGHLLDNEAVRGDEWRGAGGDNPWHIVLSTVKFLGFVRKLFVGSHFEECRKSVNHLAHDARIKLVIPWSLGLTPFSTLTHWKKFLHCVPSGMGRGEPVQSEKRAEVKDRIQWAPVVSTTDLTLSSALPSD